MNLRILELRVATSEYLGERLEDETANEAGGSRMRMQKNEHAIGNETCPRYVPE